MVKVELEGTYLLVSLRLPWSSNYISSLGFGFGFVHFIPLFILYLISLLYGTYNMMSICK